METLVTQKERKISKSLLTAGIALAIGGLFYIAYMIVVLPDAFKYKAIDWTFSITAVDFLTTLALAVMVLIAAFNPARIKYLAIPAFISAAVTTYTIVSFIIDYGFSSLDMYYFFRNATLSLALILFGIYAIKRSIAIVFSSLLITISSIFGLWYNFEQLFYSLKWSAQLGTIFAYLLLIFLALGTLFLIWSCCALFPPKTSGKDIIKKNIALSVILSVITLGVYAVFWVKSITDDIAKLEKTEINSFLETAMFFIVPFFAVYWLYENGKKMAKLADDADFSIVYSIQGLFMLCLFALALIQNQIHKAIGLSK